MSDYYATLGLPRTATADEIKKAYRRLASQHHPDKGGDTATFQKIEEAYRILSDPQQRQQHDNPIPPGFQQFNNQSPFDVNSIFEMFGQRVQATRNQHAKIQLWISLQDVALGGPRLISLDSGRGQTNVEITIPRGIGDNDQVRYPGIGPNGADLIVAFRVKPDPNWQRNGRDVTLITSCTVWDLILGSTITITDLINSQLQITVPPMTQPGTLLRVRGRGLLEKTMPGHLTSFPAGDLFIRLEAKLPSTISDQMIEAIKQERAQ
jgi:curved DNA-binding protein